MRPRPKRTIVGPGWRPGDDMDLPAWVEQGRRLGRHARWSKWWIGDWLIYGNSRWGEKYTRAARILGYDKKTLANIVYVAKRFDFSRRREELSWSHHEVVAPLTVDEQEEWLECASSQRLSVRDLRDEVRRRVSLRRVAALGASAAADGVALNGATATNLVPAAVLTSHAVKDLDTSVAFYTTLGLDVVFRRRNEHGYDEAFLGIAGERPRLELVEAKSARTASTRRLHGESHTTIWVADVDRVLKTLGSRHASSPTRESEGNAYFVRDPDGLLVKLVDASAWSSVGNGALEPAFPMQKRAAGVC